MNGRHARPIGLHANERAREGQDFFACRGGGPHPARPAGFFAAAAPSPRSIPRDPLPIMGEGWVWRLADTVPAASRALTRPPGGVYPLPQTARERGRARCAELASSP